MKKLFSFFVLMLLSIIVVSCSSDDHLPSTIKNPTSENPNIDLSENFGSEINRDFLGQIIDENHEPLPDVNITIGNKTAITDQNGVFIIKEASVYEHFAYVKARKIGYLNGSRALVPSEGTNKITIMLLQENITGTVQSGNPATISLANGASVKLEGDYQDENGNLYTGDVQVMLHHLTPDDEDMDYQMPGMLYAANTENQERMLQTYGMLSVELRGSNGEKLNLAEGTTAEISMPVPTTLSNTAPTLMPLWHFDEAKGYWIEDGEATLQGNKYVGTVSHFSFWNCDIPAEAIELCVILQDEDGNPLSDATIAIISNNYGQRSGVTNNVGQTCGLVPANETLTLKVYTSNNCITEIYSTQVGAFNTDNQEIITVNSDDIAFITGQIVDCVGNPITNGYVTLKYNNESLIKKVINGSYNISFIKCANTDTFTIEAVNFNDLESSGVLNYTFNNPQTFIGTVTACGNEITEYIQYLIDDGQTENVLIAEDIIAKFNPNPDFNTNIDYHLSIEHPYENENCFWVQARLTPPFVGQYTVADEFWNDDIGFTFIEDCPIPVYSSENGNINFNIIAIGEVGEYIDINFSGDYEDYQGNPHTITGSIHVLRDE